ncbi:hypothetical protein ACHHYP_20752 [Achlya hypogyna]|uniref:PX domain-containing protein n=1 Tax=Achlya hypogyna TaxID=1202772 RepID=A0A1V9YC69_ACHHY|nr:hypothetical protein ACHHYP_20752 [Achlya hypogyna]
MQLHVTGFQEAQEKGSKFVVYLTRVQHPSGATWTVPIRYSRYHELYTQLCKTDKAVATLPFPPKSFFAPSSEKRKQQLDAFVTKLAPIALSAKGEALVADLLHVKQHIKKEEEKKAEEAPEHSDEIDENDNQASHDTPDEIAASGEEIVDAVEPAKEGDAAVDGIATVQSTEAAVDMISKICLNFNAMKAADAPKTEPVAVTAVEAPTVTEAPIVEALAVVEAPVDIEAPVVIEAPVAVEIPVEVETVEAPVIVEAPVEAPVVIEPIAVEAPSSTVAVEVPVEMPTVMSPALVTKTRPTFNSIDVSTTDDETYSVHASKKPLSDEQKKRRNQRRAMKRKKAKKGSSSGSDSAQPVSP